MLYSWDTKNTKYKIKIQNTKNYKTQNENKNTKNKKNHKRFMSTVNFQEEKCSTVEKNSCRPISEQVCNKGRRMELHLNVFWERNYSWMLYENYIHLHKNQNKFRNGIVANWGHIWEFTVAKSQGNLTNVITHLHKLAEQILKGCTW